MINGLCNNVDDDVSKKICILIEKTKFQPVFLGNAKNTKAYRISLKPVPGLAERMSVTHASSVFCKEICTKVP